ncbi:hypothetical protein A5699_15290 [Mycobacterium sp. E802]|nr:hypothetical protein A5699_15290 [Mycobacterium sp. E802]
MVLAFSFLASLVIGSIGALGIVAHHIGSALAAPVLGTQVAAFPTSTRPTFPLCGIGILIFSKYVIH